MKNKIIIAMLMASALLACKKDPIKEDLLHYIDTELPKISDLETKAIDAYDSVAGGNYKSDSLTYVTLKQKVIPAYETFYSKIQHIKPATDQVALIHKEYIEGASDNLAAFKLLVEAIEKQDTVLVYQANTDLLKARSAIEDYNLKLGVACQGHELVLKSTKIQ